MSTRAINMAGFTLLPVILAMSLIAAIAFLLNRDNGINAGMIASQGDADRARYVAEAGLQAVNALTQGRNCAGYTDLGMTAFGAHTFTATVNPKNGTPVTLTATATTAEGASALLTRSNVTVRQTAPVTRALQPDAATGIDAWLNGASAKVDINQGSDPLLYISTTTTVSRPLLKFDLSGIPSGSEITAATLSLYQASSGSVGTSPPNPAYNVHRVTRAWVEGTKWGTGTADGATWNSTDGISAWATPGGDFYPVAAASTPAAATIGWKTWDVTGLVTDWVNGAFPNHGILLNGAGTISTLSFASSDNGTAANRPKLDVTFLPPCGWVPPATVVSLPPSADAKIDSANSTKNYGGSTVIGIKGWTMMGNEIRLLARFDTSGIVPGTLLQSAIMRFYVASITSNSNSVRTVTAYNVTEVWVEGTRNGGMLTSDGVTWNRKNATTSWISAGGSYNPTAVATLSLPSTFASGWIELDVTAVAQQWVDGMTPNNGVIVRLPNLDGEIFNINSRENAANKPQLVITY